MSEEIKNSPVTENTVDNDRSTSIFYTNGASAGKRGRKPTVMSRAEWELYYANKSIVDLINELVEIKVGGSVVVKKEEWEEMQQVKRDYKQLQFQLENFKSNILSANIFNQAGGKVILDEDGEQ